MGQGLAIAVTRIQRKSGKDTLNITQAGSWRLYLPMGMNAKVTEDV